tara:strand:+ start:140 stop:313 length:174 start_codon:yes stop_codon:yes gene_type:complete
MIVKIDKDLIHFNVNDYNNTKEMYISLWKKLYNVELKQPSTNIDNFKLYIDNKNIYI